MCFLTICRLMCGKIFVTGMYTILLSVVVISINFTQYYPKISDCSDSIGVGTSRKYGPYKLYECHDSTVIDNALVGLDPEDYTNDAYMVFFFWVTTDVLWAASGIVLLLSLCIPNQQAKIFMYMPWMLITVIHVVTNLFFLISMVHRYYLYSTKMSNKFFVFFYDSENHYRVEDLVKKHQKTLEDISNEKMSHLFQLNLVNIIALVLLIVMALEMLNKSIMINEPK